MLSNLPASIGSSKKRVAEKHLLLLYWLPQSLWLCGSHRLWTILQEMGIPDHLTCLLRNLYAGQETAVRTRHETMDWFQIGNGVHQGYIMPLCLFNLNVDTSCKMPGWMKHKLESKLPGEIPITSDMQMTPPSWQEARGTKQPLDESERGEWKS